MEVSLIVPVYNERENLRRLHDELTPVLRGLDKSYEIIYVDDGSTDGSTEILHSLAAEDPSARVIQFRRNFGQTAAINAGIHLASGDVLVTIDADLQNDPGDIPMMLRALDERDCDLVHGWRRERQDALVTRRVPSLIANWLISRVTDFPVRDLGCTLKVIRREVAQDLQLYGEMHRLTVLSLIMSGQFFVLGMLGELSVRTYHESQGKQPYTIRRLINFATSPPQPLESERSFVVSEKRGAA